MKSESESTPDTLGRRIRRQRRNLFLTQMALAGKLGVDQANVSRWETDVCMPALRHRAALAEALMISPAILFAGVEDEAA